MIIPRNKIAQFTRDLVDQCLASRQSRLNQYTLYSNYALSGAERPDDAAIYNKTYAYLDDLQSLLYSPVSLRFHISDPDLPTIRDEAFGRAAAARLRQFARASDTDTRISDAVWWSLVKGKALIKASHHRKRFNSELVQPECFGVRHENHTALDENMEAFVHTMFISVEQFTRLIWDHPDKDKMIRRARTYVNTISVNEQHGADRQVVTGGLYPFQAADSGTPNRTSGIVDWMGLPRPVLASKVQAQLMQLDELWVWNDEMEDWTTLQIIGNDMLILGQHQQLNAFAYDKNTKESTADLKGKHPFLEFCANPIADYYWGRSEVVNVALLQEAINRRITGINKILRLQEDPTKRFIGTSGVTQNTLSRYRKPGGYWADTNPNAKIETDQVQLPQDLAGWLHELERMFDEMGGLPPVARGRGDAGVRSGNHAETLVRMFSPRFKDRALLIERDVEALGALFLDMACAHEDKKIVAWMPKEAAPLEGDAPDLLIMPPAPGYVAVRFQSSDLSDDVVLTVDAHSSSPAFSQDARALVFDLFKIGAMSAEDVVQKVDVDDPEGLIAGIERRAIAKQKAEEQELALKAQTHSKK
jgi:hypothetical protein